MNRLLYAFCFAGFGLVLLRPAPAAADSFARLPGEQGKTSPLLMRVVRYAGSTNGVFIGASGYHPASLNLNLAPTGVNLGVKAPGNTPGAAGLRGPWRRRC